MLTPALQPDILHSSPWSLRYATSVAHAHKHPVAGVTFLTGKVEGVRHGDGSSTVSTAEGVSLQGSLVLDATGHTRKLVQFDKKFDPGYQGAYGIIAGRMSCANAFVTCLHERHGM